MQNIRSQKQLAFPSDLASNEVFRVNNDGQRLTPDFKNNKKNTWRFMYIIDCTNAAN